jgi:hypothetical protein
METSVKSTMKTWEVKEVVQGKRKLLGITCPQCGGKALVNKAWRAMQPAEDALLLARSKGDFQGRVFKTRPCTYCFKASWLPGEHPDEKKPGR